MSTQEQLQEQFRSLVVRNQRQAKNREQCMLSRRTAEIMPPVKEDLR